MAKGFWIELQDEDTRFLELYELVEGIEPSRAVSRALGLLMMVEDMTEDQYLCIIDNKTGEAHYVNLSYKPLNKPSKGVE